MELASPAADWLPFDLEVARREPGRVRTVVFPQARCSAVRNSWANDVIEFDNDWNYLSISSNLRLAPINAADGRPDLTGQVQSVPVIRPANVPSCKERLPEPQANPAASHSAAPQHYCLAPLPAQPAEGGWHPTSTLPAEGRVVELRLDGRFHDTFGRVLAGLWQIDQVYYGARFKQFYGAGTQGWEWRYPPGERAEATDGLGEFMRKAYEKLMGTPTINAGAEHGGQGILETASQEAPSAEHAPVPAPQRQNLAYWLALRGRAPWPESPKHVLPAVPLNAMRKWK